MTTTLIVALVLIILIMVFRYVLPNPFWFLGACYAFRHHVKAAKVLGLPTGPIWKKCLRHIWSAYIFQLDYTVTLRKPDISYSYREGTKNHVTGNSRWLAQLGYALERNRTIIRLDVSYADPDLKVKETMDCFVSTIMQDGKQHSFLALHPESAGMETLLGLTLVRLLRTVQYYGKGIDSVAVMYPRHMIDGKHNAIEYLAALNGVWVNRDVLTFKVEPAGSAPIHNGG